MERRIAAVTVFAALALSSSAVLAASPDAVKAAHDATLKAQAVTFSLLQRSGGSSMGTVTLQRIGSTRSRIRVQLANPAAAGTRVTLRSGKDCLEPRVASGTGTTQLNSFSDGRTSESIVNLPIETLRSGHYLLDVQNATARQQALDACARLNGATR